MHHLLLRNQTASRVKENAFCLIEKSQRHVLYCSEKKKYQPDQATAKFTFGTDGEPWRRISTLLPHTRLKSQ